MTGIANATQQAGLQQHHHQQTSSSASNSQHSQSGPEEPPLKLRITNVNTLPSSTIASSNNEPCNESEQIEIEPKIDYDELPSPSPPMHANSVVQQQHHQQQQQQQHPSTSTALTLTSTPTIAPATGALNLHHNNPDTDEETSYMDREFQEQELHLERMHEYFIQQQHLQHQQQHQHQHQSHLEALMQESSSSNSLRQRKERMSKKQKEVYVNFLEQNPIINEHRRNDPALNRYWLKLADVLNSVPQGAVKHVAEWKQTFDNWRYRVFLYARYNSKISGEEALNPKCFKPLTMTDKRAYNIWIRNPDTAPPDLEHMRNVFMNLEEAPPE